MNTLNEKNVLGKSNYFSQGCQYKKKIWNQSQKDFGLKKVFFGSSYFMQLNKKCFRFAKSFFMVKAIFFYKDYKEKERELSID